jgi:hypothetical protein
MLNSSVGSTAITPKIEKCLFSSKRSFSTTKHPEKITNLERAFQK